MAKQDGRRSDKKESQFILYLPPGQGYTTKQCKVFKDHLEQLVKSGHLKEFVVNPRNEIFGQTSRSQGNALPPLLGVIEVIHAASMGTSVSHQNGVLTIVPVKDGKQDVRPRKKMKLTREPIAFDDNDLEGTTQLHDVALVVTARINGFIVKRVLID